MTSIPRPRSVVMDRMVILFAVKFRHDYYNISDGKCPDLTVAPTRDCAKFMGSLGLQCRHQADGFVIFVPQSRIPALMNAVFGPPAHQAEEQTSWTRLSFFIILKNTDFIGITSLPATTSPMTSNLYTSNIEVKVDIDRFALGRNGIVGTAALHPVTNGRLPLDPHRDGTVTALDIAGRPVASVTVCAGVPAALDLAGLPYDYYSIKGSPRGTYTGPATFIYTPAGVQSVGMIDLLLTQPDGATGNPAAFPLARPSSTIPPGKDTQTTALTPVNLVLHFEARATYWKYYIVAPSSQTPLIDALTISGDGTKFQKSIDVLPNGDVAVLFTAKTPLMMAERSTYRFTLTGQRSDTNGTISVDPLPVAPMAPVWPGKGGRALTGCSEIFVYI